MLGRGDSKISWVYCSHCDICWGLLSGRPSCIRVSIVILEPLVNYSSTFLVKFNPSKFFVSLFRLPVLLLYCVYWAFSLVRRTFFSVRGAQSGARATDLNINQSLILASIHCRVFYCCSNRNKERLVCRPDCSN